MNVVSESVKSLVPRSNLSFIASDSSHYQVALYQLNNSLLKKLEPRGENKTADKAALDLFIESNARCGRWQPDETSYHFCTMLRAREKLVNRLFSGPLQAPVITLAKAIDRLRPGPGSSQGTKHTDFVGKLFHSEITTYDSSLWEYYRACIVGSWRKAEFQRARDFSAYKVVDSSRLTFAKKNYDISRVINTEASLEMLFQLGLGAQIEDCLGEWFNISLSKQPTINRHLAKTGSLYGDFATIDLKSASDLISTNFVSWFLPPCLFKTLDSVRAKRITLPGDDVLELETFSTMGNGFTFPLQTLVFSCIVEAAYEELGLPTWNFGAVPAFSVFGDDIICVSSAYEKLLSLLEWCGFTVNKTKSFNSGCFRESCGQDFFKGRDVRGIYIKKAWHETHYYSIFNRLSRWSLRNNVNLDPALRYLRGLVKFRPVPFDASDFAGLKVTLELSGLQAKKGVVKFSRLARVPRRLSTARYETNPASLLVGAVAGYLEGTADDSGCRLGAVRNDSVFKPLVSSSTGSFTLRDKPHGEPKVRQERSSTTSWDWIPQKGLTTLDYFFLHVDVI